MSVIKPKKNKREIKKITNKKLTLKNEPSKSKKEKLDQENIQQIRDESLMEFQKSEEELKDLLKELNILNIKKFI